LHCQYHSTAAPYLLVYHLGGGGGVDNGPIIGRSSTET
jgi:hypothetical protein